jgi:hypothetical protein
LQVFEQHNSQLEQTTDANQLSLFHF